MKNLLLFCTKYSQVKGDKYLTNELIDEFERIGYCVTVFVVGDVTFDSSNVYNSKREEYIYPTTIKSTVLKYLVLWPKSIFSIVSMVLRGKQFDIMIAFAPLSVMLPLILISGLIRIKKRICILFDFFPIHQVQIGIFGKKTERVFRKIESSLINNFDLITGMSPENVRMINNYYRIKNEKVDVKTLHLWGVRSDFIKRQKNKKYPEIRMVFGGQIIPGREIDKLIKMVFLIKNNGLPITLTIFSRGEGFEKLQQEYKKYGDFIFFENQLPRDEYLQRISSYDVGAIVTDNRVSMPTFPSKIIDYINCELPCFCMIETSSDIEDVVNNKDFLHVNHFSFNDQSIESACAFLGKVKYYRHSDFDEFLIKFGVEHKVRSLID